ncbi:unnamed protein product [Closterium sp. NIES-53]
MAAQELRWLTYLLTDLGERPRSLLVLNVDNKAMLALCHEQRLEHRTKHIALRYFLARELQQRGQLRLSFVASRANTTDVFTKVLGSGDHQRFCTALWLLPTLPQLLGGDPTAADTATSRRSPRLETPPGFLPRTPSPPLQPVAADFGGPGIVGGGDAGGAGSGFAAFGGARSPLVGGVGGTSAGDAGAGSAGSGGALQSLSRRPIFLEQPSSSLPEPTPTCTTPPLLFPTPESPLPAPARYVPLSVSLTGRREPVSCAASPAPSRVTREPVVLPLPPPSSLPAILDPVSDLARAARPTIPCCRAALVIAPASSHAVACALVAELAGFAATCRRAYLAGLVSASSCPPSVGGELAHGCDILEDRQFELEYLPYPLSMRTRYVAPGRHHPAHWRAARRVLRYLVRLASIT